VTNGEVLPVPPDGAPRIFRVRDTDVILDSDLAAALGLETKRLNERIERNADLVDERHCFILTAEEFAALRSQIATSKPGRGGRQYAPRVFTERGVARVTTFINTPAALRAADLIVDTFLMVRKQVAAGRQQVRIAQPSRYRRIGDDIAAASLELRKKLVSALNGLLDTVIDIREKQTVRETAQDLSVGALASIRERLREKGLENLKLEAETRRILAEAEKLAAEARRTDAEVEALHLDNLTKRIGIVRDLIALQQTLEPDHLIQLLGSFEMEPPLDVSDSGKATRLMAPNEKED
jgi:hypothetical protein